MGGFHGGFFILDELEEVCGRKMVENAKIRHFLGKNRVVVPVPMMQWESGTDTTQSGTSTHWQCGTGTGTSQSGIGTIASCNPVFACYATLSLVFVHRLFRDPNK